MFDEYASAGRILHDATFVFASTYASIPTLAGRRVAGSQDTGDEEGRAVIFGELRDCADIEIGGGVVGLADFDAVTTSLTYFDGDTNNPLPDLTRTTTASDGLFALLNVNTGAGDNSHRIVGGFRSNCAGNDCSCASLGERTVQSFPDSVAIVILRGDFPVIR